MTDSTPAEVELAWDTFHQVVNMTAEELARRRPGDALNLTRQGQVAEA